ncbi:hypothetical protein ACFLTI_01850 [Bacteroidota bacterium]
MTKALTVGKLSLAVLVIAIFTSCSLFKGASKSKNDFSGTYEYLIKDTPDGDYADKLVLTKNDGVYSATIYVQGQGLKLSNVKVENSTLTALLSFQEMELYVQISFADGKFSGDIFVGEEGFTFTGKKK